MNDERFATIRGQMATEAAKVLVDIAKELHAAGEITESRLHIAEARNVDKAAADGVIAELKAKIEAKLAEQGKADRLRAITGGRS